MLPIYARNSVFVQIFKRKDSTNIVSGPDGNIWFAWTAPEIGEEVLSPQSPTATPTPLPANSISGQVTDNIIPPHPIPNVVISAGPTISTTTNISGTYILSGLAANTYTLTPFKPGYTFSPPTSPPITVPPNATQNFTARAILQQISSDIYTNGSSQHGTEVEPDTFSFGSTIVSAFQVGRSFCGGSSNIGWATSTNGGTTWTHGFLPGITMLAGGSYDRASDASVAYDAKHGVWLISTLAVDAEAITGICQYPFNTSEILEARGVAILVSRLTNGGTTWDPPVVVAVPKYPGFFDKNWTVCDNTPTSRFYGNCYTEWDDVSSNSLIEMSTSTDGGFTWGTATPTADKVKGLGGQPLAQPNGTIVVPILSGNTIRAFSSTDGGGSWSNSVLVSDVVAHPVRGRLRTGPIPSAEIDGSGKVYVVWQDCRFIRAATGSCSANDIVMRTSVNGVNWSGTRRIPIDPIGSGVDHFIPGLAVDKTTSGTSAHLALAYYYYPLANCGTSTSLPCKLNVGFVSSINGGQNWKAKIKLAGPMNLSWLPKTISEPNNITTRMVGDYISTSFSGGRAIPAFAVARQNSGNVFDEAIYSIALWP